MSLHKAREMTEACDHHYHKRCPILPTVNCFQLADIVYWNNETCALLDVEFCLALKIIAPGKLQPVSYRTILFALVNSLFEFCLEFWRMNCWYVKITVNCSTLWHKNDFKSVDLHANDTISISLSIEELHSVFWSCPYCISMKSHKIFYFQFTLNCTLL